MERNICIGVGRYVFQRTIRQLLAESHNDISLRIHSLIADMVVELDEINSRVAAFGTEIKELAKTDSAMGAWWVRASRSI